MSRYQKGKTNLDFTEARDSERQWHHLGHTQICTSLQTNNHASTPPLSFFTGRMPFLSPNQQQCQSTEGIGNRNTNNIKIADKNADLCRKDMMHTLLKMWQYAKYAAITCIKLTCLLSHTHSSHLLQYVFRYGHSNVKACVTRAGY